MRIYVTTNPNYKLNKDEPQFITKTTEVPRKVVTVSIEMEDANVFFVATTFNGFSRLSGPFKRDGVAAHLSELVKLNDELFGV